MSVQTSRSPYVDVARMSNSIESHVQDILVQKYSATSVSSSSIRFQIKSPGVRSLLDSECLLVVPMKIEAYTKTAATRLIVVNPEQKPQALTVKKRRE